MSFRPPLSPSYNSTSFQSPSNQPPSTDDETLNRYNLHNDDDIDIEDDRDYIDVKTNGENTRLLRATSATTKAFTLAFQPPSSSPCYSLYLTIILGSANVVPWLAFISVQDYWNSAYPGKGTGFMFPVLNMGLLAVGTVSTAFFGRTLPLRTRLQLSNILISLLLLTVPLLILPFSTSPLSLPSLYAILATLSLCTAVNQSSCYGWAGVMGPEFICSLERGKGWSGVGIVLVRSMLKAHYQNTKGSGVVSTKVFFYFAACVVAAAIWAYERLVKEEFVKGKLREYERTPSVQEMTPNHTPRNTPGNAPIMGKSKIRRNVELMGLSKKVKNRVLRKIALPASCVFLVFTLCISCFPGIATSLKSTTLNLDSWFPIAMVGCYNTADLVGKTIPTIWCPWNGRNAWVTVVPILGVAAMMVGEMLAEVSPSIPPSWSVPILRSDVTKLSTSFTLGVLTGYSSTTCMMVAPGMVKERYREFATQAMATFLILGLLMGSLVGVGIKNYVGVEGGDSNPPYPVINWGPR